LDHWMSNLSVPEGYIPLKNGWKRWRRPIRLMLDGKTLWQTVNPAV